MASDVPAFLEVGTPVSAKFKGAFCEATIKKIKKLVKCKVVFKSGLGSVMVNSERVVGDLVLNSLVQVKSDDGELREGMLSKMNDHSLYTVVFDDGDERTLKRTNVCVMGEKHFNEHENLDNLPLTDPENFLSPVLLGTEKRRKRTRPPTAAVDDEDSDSDKSARRLTEIDKEFLGKVVCIEHGERKKTWFPALGLKNFVTQPENHVYVQSFKDGKKMLVQREDVKEFHKNKEPLASYFKGEIKIDPILRSSIDKALAYNDFGELPKGWNILDTIDEKESSDEDSSSPSIACSDLPLESKNFQEMINDFMGRQGIPVTKPAVINNQAVNLLQLYNIVAELGGMEEVTNQQWRNIYLQLGLQNIHSAAAFSVKSLYKRYLSPYENYTKNLGKSSPGPSQNRLKTRRSAKDAIKDDADQSSVVSESDSEPERRRSTRSRNSNANDKSGDSSDSKKRQSPPTTANDSGAEEASDKNSVNRDFSEQEMDLKSETEDVDVVNSPQSSMTSEDNDSRIIDSGVQIGKYKPGARIAVHYGSRENHRLYNAKILEVERETNGEVVYFVHYNGWNHRYDEWIKDERIHGPSTNGPGKRKNGPPPTPLSRIRKDPPKKFQAKIDLDTALSKQGTQSDTPPPLLPPNKKSTPQGFAEGPELPKVTRSSVLAGEKVAYARSPAHVSEKLHATSEKSPITDKPHIAEKPVEKSHVEKTYSSRSPAHTSEKVLTAISEKLPYSRSPAHVAEKVLVEKQSFARSPAHVLEKNPISEKTYARSPAHVSEKLSHSRSPAHISEKLSFSRSPAHISEKLPYPMKSPVYIPENIPEPPVLAPKSQIHVKQPHRPKPVNEALLFIPDIKPSPVKPRLTRNSMQDTFLLNALEESIGKQNTSAMNLQQDVLQRSESATVRQRRSSRQTESPFMKCDSTLESDMSTKEDKDSSIDCSSGKLLLRDDKLHIPEFDSPCYDAGSVEKKAFPSLGPKESSKEETVKKWIEDSNKILSKSTSETSEDDVIGKDSDDPILMAETVLEEPPEKPVKRGRRSKNNKNNEKSALKTKMVDDSDYKREMVKPEPMCHLSHDGNNNINNPSSKNKDSSLSCKKEEVSDTSQLLSDFCSIVENAHKLEANTEDEKSTQPSSCTERPPRHRRSSEKHKRKISHSDGYSKSPKSPKKEKRVTPRLEYNVDFMSDLPAALAEKDAVERIVIMQSRMNAMRKLYCKLRSEVASIDRKKRRKLRKQMESGKQQKACV